MDKNRNFERELPANYLLIKHVDASGDKKLVLAYSLLSFVPFLLLVPLLCVIAYFASGYNIIEEWGRIGGTPMLVTCAVLLSYIFLHELTHGITYKCFTGGKLKYGLSLTVAFCGVPDLYVRRRASFAALIMPFAVFSVIFGGLTIGLYFVSPLYSILAGVVFAIHLGGCVGDLHWVLLYLTKFRHCDLLMRDTGPQQWLYIREEEAKARGIAPVLLLSAGDAAAKTPAEENESKNV